MLWKESLKNWHLSTDLSNSVKKSCANGGRLNGEGKGRCSQTVRGHSEARRALTDWMFQVSCRLVKIMEFYSKHTVSAPYLQVPYMQIQPSIDQKCSEKKKNQESSKNQSLNLPGTGNC